MVDWAQLYLFELIFMRMSGFLLFNPLLGRSNLPAMVKTGMALVLSILVFGTAGTGVPQPDTLVERGWGVSTTRMLQSGSAIS